MGDRFPATDDPKVLALHWLAASPRPARDVWEELRRLLGHRPSRRAHRVVWSDVWELAHVLIADSETFAARVRREVAAAERGTAGADLTEFRRVG
jgi:hypothetical protein